MRTKTKPEPAGIDTPPAALSPRELEVAHDLAEGATNREIGERLGISTKTVDTHRGHVIARLGLRNNADVTRWAIQHGIVRVPAVDGLLKEGRAFVRDATAMLVDNGEDEEDVASGNDYVDRVTEFLGDARACDVATGDVVAA